MNDSGTSASFCAETVPTKKKGRVTFFLRSGASIKIGTAKNFEKRLASLQEKLSRPLETLAVVPAKIAPEAELRERFADLAMRHRWFRADRALLDHIEALKVQAAELRAAELAAAEAARAAEEAAKAALEAAEPPVLPLPATEIAARRLIAKIPSLPKTMHHIAYGAVAQLQNMATYVQEPWVVDERQTLPYWLAKSHARLGG